MAQVGDIPIPGYGGYLPRYVTEPAPKNVPAFKYTFVAEVPRGVMDEDRNSSVYARSMAVTVGPGKDYRAKPLQKRELGEYDPKPGLTSHWVSEYRARMNAPETFARSRELEAKGRVVDEKARAMARERAAAVTAPEATVTRPEWRTTHQTDFGLYGQSPLSRSANIATPRDLSLRSTTADLLAGTGKIAGRVPGYTGHVPASARNLSATRGDKGFSGLLEIPEQNYRQHMAGASVFQPKTAVNVVRAREAHSNPPTQRVWRASLITDSMKGTLYS